MIRVSVQRLTRCPNSGIRDRNWLGHIVDSDAYLKASVSGMLLGKKLLDTLATLKLVIKRSVAACDDELCAKEL
jgi:L-amino acid N-acyltransferase YncA